MPLVGYALGGFDIVGLGLGGYFAWRASSKDGDSRQYLDADGNCIADTPCMSLTDESHSAAKVATVSFILGGAALIGGAIIVLTSASGTHQSGNAQVSLRPLAGLGVAGAAMTGAW